jgi:hypothetical protein
MSLAAPPTDLPMFRQRLLTVYAGWKAAFQKLTDMAESTAAEKEADAGSAASPASHDSGHTDDLESQGSGKLSR